MIKILKKSTIVKPKLSILVQDWGVRESFHFFDYLKKQNISKNEFEIVFVDFYNELNPKIKNYFDFIDTAILLNFSKDFHYHKHLMFNAGLLFSNGKIFCICDSDAIVDENFCNYIINFHHNNPRSYLHIDQFRNENRDYYPFNFPNYDELIKNSYNYKDGKTTGILDDNDPAHQRNAGACGSAHREDLIKNYGADESIDYLGHICGNDDMSKRFANNGGRFVWAKDYFIAHAWHPGTGSQKDLKKKSEEYWGPHDDCGTSMLIRQIQLTGRTKPIVINKAIKQLKLKLEKNISTQLNDEEISSKIIDVEKIKYYKKGILKSFKKYKNLKILDIPITNGVGLTPIYWERMTFKYKILKFFSNLLMSVRSITPKKYISILKNYSTFFRIKKIFNHYIKR